MARQFTAGLYFFPESYMVRGKKFLYSAMSLICAVYGLAQKLNVFFAVFANRDFHGLGNLC